MDIRRCDLVVGVIAVTMVVTALVGVFNPRALLPSAVVDGRTRSFIALATVLVAAMVIAMMCRRT